MASLTTATVVCSLSQWQGIKKKSNILEAIWWTETLSIQAEPTIQSFMGGKNWRLNGTKAIKEKTLKKPVNSSLLTPIKTWKHEFITQKEKLLSFSKDNIFFLWQDQESVKAMTSDVIL